MGAVELPDDLRDEEDARAVKHTIPLPRRKKSGRWWKISLLAAVGLGAVVLVVSALSYFLVRNYLYSDGFRQLLAERASSALRAKVDLAPLSWQDTTGSCARLSAEGQPGAPFSRASAEGLRATVDLDGIRQKEWRVPDVEIEKLSIELLQTPPAAEPLPVKAKSLPPPPVEGGGMPWYAGWIPDKFVVKLVRVGEASIHYARDGQDFTAERIQLGMEPGEGAGMNVFGTGGVLRWGGGKKFNLEEFSGRLSGTTFYLTSLGAHSAEGGTVVHASGEAGPEMVALKADFSNAEAADLVAEDWRRRLHGMVDGEVELSGPTKAVVARGQVRLKQGRLELLPVLDKIADHTKSDGFRRLAISEARTNFRRTPERLEIRQFFMESPGLLQIKGDADIVDGRIDGSFMVGIAPGTLRWIPGAESRVFRRGDSGLLWASMRVVGPVDSPSEDLSGRLTDAAVAQTIEEVPGKVLETAKDAAGKVLDAAPGVIEKGAGLLDKGIDALKGFVPLFK